jgi:hypothetical protein
MDWAAPSSQEELKDLTNRISQVFQRFYAVFYLLKMN